MLFLMIIFWKLCVLDFYLNDSDFHKIPFWYLQCRQHTIFWLKTRSLPGCNQSNSWNRSFGRLIETRSLPVCLPAEQLKPPNRPVKVTSPIAETAKSGGSYRLTDQQDLIMQGRQTCLSLSQQRDNIDHIKEIHSQIYHTRETVIMSVDFWNWPYQGDSQL